MLRATFNIGARIEQHGRTAARWDGGRQSGSIDARDHPEGKVCGQHGRAGMAGAEERVRFVPRHQVGCDANRSTRLATRGNGRFRHLDHVWSLDDANLKPTPIGVTLERWRNRGGGSNQNYLQVEVTGGGNGTVHDGGRRVVATHRINGDSDHW